MVGGTSVDLANLRLQARSFHGELSREQYLVASGQKAEPDIAAIYRRWSHLFEPAPVAELQRLVAGEPDPQRRDVAQRYLGFLVRGVLEHAVREQSTELQRRLHGLEVTCDGKRVPFPLAQALLASEANRERRRDWQDAIDLARRVHLNPLAEEILAETQRQVRTLGYRDYVLLWNELKNLDLERFLPLCDQILRETDEAARSALARDFSNHMGLDLDEVEIHDHAFLNRAPAFDAHFPPDRVVQVLERTLSQLGLDITGHGHIRMDLEPRERKSPRAFCAAIRIPEDVVLVMLPRGGWRDFNAALHEAGHSQHYGNVAAGTPFEYGHLGDISVSEMYAFLLQHLMMDRGWLVAHLGLEEPELSHFLAFQRRAELMLVRRYVGKLRYELQLYVAKDPALQADAYTRELRTATFLPYRAVDYITDLDPGLYAAQYLRAWMAEAQMRHVFRERWGSQWWRSPAAGAFLRDLWALGQRHDVVSLVQMLGMGALDPGLLIDDLLQGS